MSKTFFQFFTQEEIKILIQNSLIVSINSDNNDVEYLYSSKDINKDHYSIEFDCCGGLLSITLLKNLNIIKAISKKDLIDLIKRN